jgi:environmental stress-induced protein Ves
MAWRNGGGETRELAVWPQGTGLDAFEWRVSVATIARNGPFSRFPGCTRTAVLTDGAGFRLVDGRLQVELAERFAQATFAGAPAWQCELMEGPVEVLNVMVRSRFRAEVDVARGVPHDVPAALHRVAHAACGTSAIALGTETVVLHEGDACEVHGSSFDLRVQPQPGACVLVASMKTAAAR